MTAKPKVFISFSTEDRQTAYSLYDDLSKAGADVFQFEESATPGKAAWDEVLENIESSDVFILLASKSALKSRPVMEEIRFAYYQHVNDTRPGMLIPLMLERELRLPRELRAINQIAFDSYDAGLQRLFKLLNLENPAEPEAVRRDEATRPPVKPETTPHKRTLQEDGRVDPPAETVPDNTPAEPVVRRAGNATARSIYKRLSAVRRLGRYAAVIGTVAITGAVAGWFINWWLASLKFEIIPAGYYVGSRKEYLTWLLRLGGILSLILIVWMTFHITDARVPMDGLDYAVVTAAGVALALVSGLLLSFLLSRVAGGSSYFVFLNVGAAAATVFFYAVREEI